MIQTLSFHGTRFAVAVAVCVSLGACGEKSSDSSTVRSSDEVPAAAELPEVQLSVWNADNRTVQAKSYKVQGTATPGALVEVDDDSMTAGEDGRWTIETSLDVGENTITIDASHGDRRSASEYLTVTRRRTAAELEARRVRQQEAADRRARKRAAAEAKKAANAAKPNYDNPSMTQINSMMTDYLSAVINDPTTADPWVAAADFEDAAASASPGCAKELRATAAALVDTTGGPDEIRYRVLDAANGAFLECG